MSVSVVEADRDESWGTCTWRAAAGDEQIGDATAWVRPDGRCFVSFKDCAPRAYAPLLESVASAGHRVVYITANESDTHRVSLYRRLGFEQDSREQNYVIPVASAVAALAKASLPAGATVISPEAADEDRLRAVDDELRNDVPGQAGWRWSAEAFRDETGGPPYDPALYAVAVSGDEYIGIGRVWNRAPRPRLGMIGVVRPHRRQGLAGALLGIVFGELRNRSVREAVTEVDVTNVASNALIRRLGGEVVGYSVELVRRFES